MTGTAALAMIALPSASSAEQKWQPYSEVGGKVGDDRAIGQVEFDEIQAVLERELYLVPDFTRADVYIEFAAVFLELTAFSPDWLGDWFPSLADPARIRELVIEDVDADRLLATCRPRGAPDLVAVAGVAAPLAGQAWDELVHTPPARPRPDRVVRARLLKAERYAARGNAVRAARIALEARDIAAGPLIDEARDFAERQVDSLARRLVAALELAEADVNDWAAALRALFPLARVGFFNPDTRLLYDLQTVCIDFEREVFVVDAIEWIWSLGRRPLRRPLPNQRDVRMSRHLRSAMRRLTSSRLPADDRTRLSGLLSAAAGRVEHRTRHTLAPLVREALDEVDLVPTNTPERVAYRKIVEECLDLVVETGFFTMGQVRDVLSRNDLKLRDVQSWRDVVFGDQLLRLNFSLTDRFDGVYHPAEFYLRWLQGLSSVAFGTPLGRFITQYIVLPFGGAFVILEGVNHILHAVRKVTTEATAHSSILSPPP